ncbi:GMC family oxidoreductase [Micromonospora aurantiaca]|nr:GMC family oxidoreductase [Micromonospora aurantiaca]
MSEERRHPAVVTSVLGSGSAEWEKISARRFDHVIVGSGICSVAFADAVLRHDPQARILIVEQGGFLLPENLQGLDAAFAPLLGPASESYPWRTHDASDGRLFVRGILPYLGGKSLTWSGWCPRPTSAELAWWPAGVASTLGERFAEAESLLGVLDANAIGTRFGWYGGLQHGLQAHCTDRMGVVPGLRSVEPARLALADGGRGELGFRKFAVPALLFGLADRIDIVPHCRVKSIERRAGTAVALRTTRGTLPLRGANLILAAGTIPSTALVMGAFPELTDAGRNLTAHSITLVRARIPVDELPFAGSENGAELAALHLPGATSHSAFHLQITGVRCGNPGLMYPVLRRHAPDCDAFVTADQLAGSERHVVLTCAALGEHGSGGDCRVIVNGDHLRVELSSSELDRSTWDAMDTALFGLVEDVLSSGRRSGLEYWVEGALGGRWARQRPSTAQCRLPGLVHEASTLRMGEAADSVVDLNYRLRGATNVYITGGALWPTGSSANPTLTMVALAQDLADRLTASASQAR